MKKVMCKVDYSHNEQMIFKKNEFYDFNEKNNMIVYKSFDIHSPIKSLAIYSPIDRFDYRFYTPEETKNIQRTKLIEKMLCEQEKKN